MEATTTHPADIASSIDHDKTKGRVQLSAGAPMQASSLSNLARRAVARRLITADFNIYKALSFNYSTSREKRVVCFKKKGPPKNGHGKRQAKRSPRRKLLRSVVGHGDDVF